MILLDTSVLSLALRRRQRPEGESRRPAAALVRMVMEDWQLAIPGIVVQELLSGVRTPAEVERLEEALAGFPVVLADHDDHLRAARIANQCRAAGITASSIDCLIAALALGRQAELFTTDGDFADIAACCELRLFVPAPPLPGTGLSDEELRRRGSSQLQPN